MAVPDLSGIRWSIPLLGDSSMGGKKTVEHLVSNLGFMGAKKKTLTIENAKLTHKLKKEIVIVFYYKTIPIGYVYLVS